jgi:putative FmdB family regulatory protein
MPMFEFRCQACGEEFEELLRSPEDEVACPECDSSEVQRKMSVFGFKSGSTSRSSAPASGGHSCSSCAGGSCGSCGH